MVFSCPGDIFIALMKNVVNTSLVTVAQAQCLCAPVTVLALLLAASGFYQTLGFSLTETVGLNMKIAS